MDKRIRKSSVKKTDNNIEVILGNPSITKYDVMKQIAQTHTIYGATVWLNTPLAEYEDQTPADLMRAGKMELVAKLVTLTAEENNTT